VFDNSALLFTAKKCQTLDEYSEKTVGGAMGCDVLETNYTYSRTTMVENSIVSEQELVAFYTHRKS